MLETCHLPSVASFNSFIHQIFEPKNNDNFTENQKETVIHYKNPITQKL